MNILTIKLSEDLWSKAVNIGVERQAKNEAAGRGNAGHYKQLNASPQEELFSHVRGCLGEAAWHQYFVELEDATNTPARGEWQTGFAWDVADHYKYVNKSDLWHFGWNIEVKTIKKPYNSVGLKRKDVNAGNALAVAYVHAKPTETPATYSRIVSLVGIYDLSIIQQMPSVWESLDIPWYDDTHGVKCRNLPKHLLMSAQTFGEHLNSKTTPIFKYPKQPVAIPAVERNPFWD